MILQNITFEQDHGVDVRNLFYRGEAVCLKKEHRLIFRKGDEQRFDAFFNFLSVKTWKKECGIADVHLKLCGKGQFLIRFGCCKAYKPLTWLGDEVVSLNGCETIITMPFWSTLQSGLVFFTLTALSDGEISQGGFYTEEKVRREVKLGIVITHFNRQQFVVPAVHRLHHDLLEDARYQTIELAVVDNSRNLTLPEVDNKQCIHVVKNPNVGGSGGFARGLLFFKDKKFTHCLFMDDDASCHVESIKRIFSYWSYVIDDSALGLSGIMLDENRPTEVYEASGKFSQITCRSLGAKLKLAETQNSILIEQLSGSGNYGAWCFYSFPLKSIKHYPFPFFVRGDDILFSLQNNLHIVLLLGVATWVDSFANKNSATTVYLSARSDLVLSLYSQTASRLIWINRFFVLNRSSVFSYNYSRSYGLYRAYYDVLCNIDLFSEDIEGKRFRKSLKNIPVFSVAAPLEWLPEKKKNKAFWMSAVRKLTANCFLIPKTLLGDCVKEKTWEPMSWKLTCFYNTIYGFNNDTGDAAIRSHNKVEMLKSFYRNFVIACKVFVNFSSCKKRYESDLMNFTTEQFWRRIFKL